MTRYPFVMLLGVLFIVAISSLFVGAANLTSIEVVSTLLNGGEHDFIVNQYRLPRLILAILVGAGLGLSGAIVQGVIRNPLASPDLMGISAGAGLFATGLLVVVPDAPDSYLPIAAVIGGIFAAVIIWVITRLSKPTPARLALIGISISAFLGSMIDFLLVVHPIEINTAMIWLTGSLWGRNWDQVPYIIAALAVLVPIAWWLAWKLNVMSLGEENATSLGVVPKRVQVSALGVAVILSSVSVSICGTISFVGLLAPHLSRLIVGHDHKRLLPCAAIIGGLLVLVSDALARGIQPPVELPAGVLTSLIGAPYFIFLLRRYKGW